MPNTYINATCSISSILSMEISASLLKGDRLYLRDTPIKKPIIISTENKQLDFTASKW